MIKFLDLQNPTGFQQTFIEAGESFGAKRPLLDRAKIGYNAQLEAGDFATKYVPPNTISFGNPVKQKGILDDSRKIIYS